VLFWRNVSAVPLGVVVGASLSLLCILLVAVVSSAVDI